MDDVNRLLDYLEIRSPATRQIYASMAQRRHLKKARCFTGAVRTPRTSIS